ncbi:MAG: site-specific integrase [Pseudomonadota bacterium]
MAKRHYPGVRRYEGPSGTTYQALVRVAGYKHESRTFRSQKAAADWKAERERELKRLGASETRASDETVAGLVGIYTKSVLPKLKSSHDRAAHLRYLVDRCGARKLHLLSGKHLSKAKDELASEVIERTGKPRSDATVRRYLASWSHLLKFARKKKLIVHDPMAGIERPEESKGRTRYLSDQEELRLLEACSASDNAYLHAAVVASLCSGARQGEVMRLLWGDLDMAKGLAWLHSGETKNREAKAIHLAPALDLLKQLRRATPFPHDDEPVFPKLDGALPVSKRGRHPLPSHLRKAWGEALAAAKIAGFRWHDLRHTSASRMLAAGATLGVIGEVLGHKAAQTTMRYAHLSNEAGAAAVAAAWSRRLK